MPSPSPPLLELTHANVQRDGRLILNDLSLEIALGEHTAILGANGSGKSTLVKLITRQIYPLARPGGQPVLKILGRERWSVTELRSRLGIVSPAMQTDFTSDTPLEVYDAVISGFFAARGLGLDHVVTEAMHQAAAEALATTGASHLVGRMMDSLSTGEARRVLIARAMVHRPQALLLDEPCAGLDLASRRDFLESLRDLARAGTTLLLVTHHIEEILPEIQRVVMLRQGELVADTDKTQALNSAQLSELFATPVTVSPRGEWFWAALD
ncbi:ABC transporter ATP-binding protein [Frateuria aurantia]